FELDGPVAVERPFGTGSDGPAGASVAPAQRNRWRIGAEMAIGETARRVEQKLRRRQQAHAAARRAEPVESIICREEQRSRRAACGRAQRAGRMLVAALEVTLETDQPILKLPVVASLTAANHAIDIRAAKDRQGRQRGDDRQANWDPRNSADHLRARRPSEG